MSGEFCKARLSRMNDILQGHVASGEVPGLVALVSRCGETHVMAHGSQALDGAQPMQRDTIFRIASMTKPIVAAAAMILIEECRFRLDDPVDRFLPELANPKVLKSLESDVDDTEPARRSISVRDLLTFRLGTGAVMAFPPKYPIQKAIAEAGFAPGGGPIGFTPDEYMRKVGGLPLIYQPGMRWMYHTGSDLLGVLIARAVGQVARGVSPGEYLRAARHEGHRLPRAGRQTGAAGECLSPRSMRRMRSCCSTTPSRQPLEPAEALPVRRRRAGLDGRRLSRLLPHDAEQGPGNRTSRTRANPVAGERRVDDDRSAHDGTKGRRRALLSGKTRAAGAWAWRSRRNATELWGTPGRFGWDGGYGTSGYADPAEDMVGVLLTQRTMDSPVAPRVYTDFWTTAYSAIND